MPSAAPEGHVGFVCKKRRRDECGSLSALHSMHTGAPGATPLDDDVFLFDKANSRHHSSSSSCCSNTINSSSNNINNINTINTTTINTTINTINTTTTTTINSHCKILPVGKRLRLDDDWKPAHRPLLERIAPTSTANPPSTAPCHICHRRPRRRCDLDSLADCEGCGERTCFVCLRECLGTTMTAQSRRRLAPDGVGRDTLAASPPTWSRGCSGHRRMICSRCCVERGQDGQVVCLGCLPFVEG